MKYLIRRTLALAAITFASASTVSAQDAFPSRPIRILVNTAPGGLTDVVTRLVAKQMTTELGQSVVVENRAGGDGLIGIRAVKTSPPDGYTLLASAGTVSLQMAYRRDPGYDLTKDFVGIASTGRSPFLVVTAPSLPDKSMADLVNRAKANPNKLSYASAGNGTVPHLGTVRFLYQLGLKVEHVPYKGNGAAMTDVMSGRVDFILEAYGSSSGKVAAGQLRVLGVTGDKRLPSLPAVPTVAEQVAPGYSWYTWFGLLAPTGTPPAVVQRLNKAVRAAMASPEIKERFRSDAIEAPDLSPAEFDRFLEGEIAQYRKIMESVGLEPQ